MRPTRRSRLSSGSERPACSPAALRSRRPSRTMISSSFSRPAACLPRIRGPAERSVRALFRGWGGVSSISAQLAGLRLRLSALARPQPDPRPDAAHSEARHGVKAHRWRAQHPPRRIGTARAQTVEQLALDMRLGEGGRAPSRACGVACRTRPGRRLAQTQFSKRYLR